MSEKLNTIIEQLKSLTLLEAAELVKEIETVFGVDTSMSVGTMAAAAPIAAAPAEAAEEKTAFDVILDSVPADKKIAILKIVRNVTGLGLKESKDIVDNVPKLLKEGASKEEGETIKKDVEVSTPNTISISLTNSAASNKVKLFNCSMIVFNFSEEQLKENLIAVHSSIEKNKPTGVKGRYFKSFNICTTMSPGIPVELSSFKKQ